ncbi:hypothetical protein BOTBODRAFT_33341 [Botryobasidium botryosum FD-172 SS1]|uniref:Mitochondrial carrier protein n=1 Tax=Botryobasidium botryosum (strain FD-172 SS1) TaxID=930990 RepID=A0A067MDJ1_BOTB1|nr:hypothetical protein BOTBODRAFT_33341 [Botryobasidium botryosum FD-172 SS1]
MSSSSLMEAARSPSKKTTPTLSARMVAASTGATMTGLTMTPFDVIKTRLQTQPSPPSSSSSTPSSASSRSLFPRPPPGTCCQPSNQPCVRGLSSLALAAIPRDGGGPVVCLWDGKVMRSERVNGPWDAAVKVWKLEGVRGLWKGVGTTLVVAVPSQTVYMVTYDTLLHTIPPYIPSVVPPALHPLIAGITARTFVTTAASPLELLRTRLQSTPPNPHKPHTLRSTLRSVREMTRTHGVRSLWRGLSASLWRDVPFSGIYWATYEALKVRVTPAGVQPDTGATFACGATGGTIAALFTHPFDVLKTRRQALSMQDAARNRGTIGVVREILRTEGWRALFAGVQPRIAKIAPACGIMIACYEGVARYVSP